MSFMDAQFSDALAVVNSVSHIAQFSGLLCNGGMKPITQIRRENLELAIRRAGSLAALADKAHTSKAYLSQVRHGLLDSKTGRPREIGDALARRIEQALHEPLGWMDHDHAEPVDDLRLTQQERDIVLAFRSFPEDYQNELHAQMMADAERFNAYAARVLRQHGVTSIAPNERVAEKLPPAPRTADAKKTAAVTPERRYAGGLPHRPRKTK